ESRKMRKSFLTWPLMLALGFTLAACGGKAKGSDGNTDNQPSPNAVPSTVSVASGIFVDAPVEGLTFVSGAQTGVTNASGQFKFETGGTVHFKLGSVVLGQAQAKAIMTPLDLVQAVSPSATETDPRVVQMVQFLMTVNSNPSTAITMSIPAIVAEA